MANTYSIKKEYKKEFPAFMMKLSLTKFEWLNTWGVLPNALIIKPNKMTTYRITTAKGKVYNYTNEEEAVKASCKLSAKESISYEALKTNHNANKVSPTMKKMLVRIKKHNYVIMGGVVTATATALLTRKLIEAVPKAAHGEYKLTLTERGETYLRATTK